ncbi:Ctr-domain-containing protein [Ascobolus immersus RN42]|uniref:Copper transport protein n=1 Tax=Ascobolus immersus RN42 TaxID=1160509 RepID=A0A3N4I426_ASCIM|nr:Ctr-domain-containing protein [Ascobolus immersus RN42]
MDHGMDHSNHMATSTIADIVATATETVATAATTAAKMAKGHGGMGYTPGTCRISMLWNWYVIDSCFISRTWHNKTTAMFAGSCIGVVIICIILEFVRRVQREYDRAIVRQWTEKQACSLSQSASEEGAANLKTGTLVLGKSLATPLTFRPTFMQQFIRALLYVVQFWAAYLIMLLAMYYNGYIIICILIGVFLGHFIFGYDNITIGGKQETGTSCC